MDGSRETDLQRLHSIFTNTSKPKFDRFAARRSFNNIKVQMQDRHLTKLRWALIQASRNGKEKDTQNIVKQIEMYSRRQGWFKPRMV